MTDEKDIELEPEDLESKPVKLEIKDNDGIHLKCVKVTLFKLDGKEVGTYHSNGNGLVEAFLRPDLEGSTLKFEAVLHGFEVKSDSILVKWDLLHQVIMKKRGWLRKLLPIAAALIAGIVLALGLCYLKERFFTRKPEIVRFEVEPTKVHRGQQAKLSWKILYSDKAQITGIGPIKESDEEKFRPKCTTTYALIAENESGDKATQTVEVIVDLPLVTMSEPEENTARPKGGYKSIKLEDYNHNLCMEKCKNEETCKAWTYWLKKPSTPGPNEPMCGLSCYDQKTMAVLGYYSGIKYED